MGRYYHNAVSVTYISMSVLHMLAKGVDFISNEVSLRLDGLKGRLCVPWKGYMDDPFFSLLGESYDNLAFGKLK